MSESTAVRTRALSLTKFVFVLAVPLLQANAASAATQCGDGTCPKGFSCETETAACPEIACVGDDCKQCTPSTYTYCKPQPCQADKDCEAGMLCHEFEQGCDATAPACSGADCPKPEEGTTCTATVVKQCTPRWQLPCSSASDCGAGFTCEARQECSCGGSTGSSGGGAEPSGTAGAASSAPDCTCRTSSEKSCQVVRTACNSDSDCVGGFSCQPNPEGACSQSSDGKESCTPVDPPKLCMPPYSEVTAGGKGLSTDAEASANGDRALDGSKPSGGGCSVARVGETGGAAPFLIALGAALGLARRRRRN